eukprot:Hpha_TRINITY_DN3299_c0_g1::TRINITY_DN3299_c0_g1_i1::g.185964::m.185964
MPYSSVGSPSLPPQNSTHSREPLVSRLRTGKVIVGQRRKLQRNAPPSSWSRVAQEDRPTSVSQPRRMLAPSPSPQRSPRFPVPGGVVGGSEVGSEAGSDWPVRGVRRPSPFSDRNPILGVGIETPRERRGRAMSAQRIRETDVIARPAYSEGGSAAGSLPPSPSTWVRKGGERAPRSKLNGGACAVSEPASDATSVQRLRTVYGKSVDRGRRKTKTWFDAPTSTLHRQTPGGWTGASRGLERSSEHCITLPAQGSIAARAMDRGLRRATHWYDESTQTLHTQFPSSQVAWLQQGAHATQHDDERRRGQRVRPPIPFSELQQRHKGGKMRCHATYDDHSQDFTHHYPASQIAWAPSTANRPLRGVHPQSDPPGRRVSFGSVGSVGSTGEQKRKLPPAGVRTGSSSDRNAVECTWSERRSRQGAPSGVRHAQSCVLIGSACNQTVPADALRFTSPCRQATQGVFYGAGCCRVDSTSERDWAGRTLAPGSNRRGRRSLSASHSDRNPITGHADVVPPVPEAVKTGRCRSAPRSHRDCITGAGVKVPRVGVPEPGRRLQNRRPSPIVVNT